MSIICSAIKFCIRSIVHTVEDTYIRGVDHVAVAFYVDCFACADDVFGHIGFVVEG